jgi:hypothetical protein
MLKLFRIFSLLLLSFVVANTPAMAQQTLGAINGTVTDASGGVVPDAKVTVRNNATNLEVTQASHGNGSFEFVDLPIGTYTVTFAKDGFKTEVHSQILVRGNLTSTVNGALQPGDVSSTVTVSATPLMNQTDTSNGYTLGSELVESIPLGTGSFTQLAVLAPGVSADLLSGNGAGAGLGNQAIWANGQRDTSNSISFNSVNANNLFNGKTTSYDNTARFILNTGESFATPGQTQTSTSVYNAIGEGIPTPPVETIQEVHVTTSMYDASQGANSGAHIELTTASGTNQLHGQAYEYYSTNAWNATPYFLKATGLPIGQSTPELARNVFGGTIGGPIIKDKLFFFGSYQGLRVSDGLNGAVSGTVVPQGLTDTRDAATLAALANTDFGSNITAADVTPQALAIMNAKTPGGQYLIPSQNLTADQTTTLGYNALLQGPTSKFSADQVNGNVDYVFGAKDRLAAKYYYQRNPSTVSFAIASTLGFPQTLNAGSQVFSLDNTTILTPSLSWEQRFGFIREVVNAKLSQGLSPDAVGISLPGVAAGNFPGITITNADDFTFNKLSIGASSNFANAGVVQNQFEAATNLNWVKGRHTLSFGFSWDYGQLNILNRENEVANITFKNFVTFLQGEFGGRNGGGTLINGATNRYYRSNQAGAFAQDNFRLKKNLTVNLGLRWDWDGPLWEKYGRLTNFYPQDYSYDLGTDTINNIGLVVAGNNSTFGTKGVSNSTLTGRQWGFAPRIGLVWAPTMVKNITVRAGFGLYYDRGEFFSELSPSAGLGISGPFGVTTELPFAAPVNTSCVGVNCFAAPFGTGPLPPPPSDLSQLKALIYNQSQLSGCPAPVTPSCTPTGDPLLAYLFGGYDPRNKLPYSENWSLDLQWQPYNTLLFSLAYLGNHGVHQVIPVPFNQPTIATPQNPVNGQIYSYGYQATDAAFNPLLTEQVQTTIGEFSASDGNTALRVPYIGYNPNSDFWKAEGISHYNALQLQVTKRLSHGFQINGSYTWSHALDEQSGLGLFFNGNNPLVPKSSYASSDFDRTHVIVINYLYQFPHADWAKGVLNHIVNNWSVSGVTTLESGQPFTVYDFSGSVGGIYYSADDFITNPVLPLNPGVSPSQAQTQGTTGVNAGRPYFSSKVFSIPLLSPGQNGVPPCGPTTGGTSVCDTFETGFGPTGRNVFRAPFQSRFDFSVQKIFNISERFKLKYEVDVFNLFNHPSFDAPNNNVTLNPCFNPNPCYTNPPPSSQNIGFITDTIGGPRFLQMVLHLSF